MELLNTKTDVKAISFKRRSYYFDYKVNGLYLDISINSSGLTLLKPSAIRYGNA